MVEVTPQELRDFSAMLHPADFAPLARALPGFELGGGGMPDADKLSDFVKQWAPEAAGFSLDLRRGIDAFGTVARNSADAFETTDQVAAGRFLVADQHASEIVADQLGQFRTGGGWTVPLPDLPKAPTP
ncbi:hypothetical protein [Kribbella sp. NPDC004875]|uniref:hypothetical protein n=1 Tax=Kribbella sp. NPDC004875 TaxID=3364107 RepID=UPI0036767740